MSGQQCAKQISNENIDQIECKVAFTIDDSQKEQLAELTAGVLLDAECTAAIDIARKVVFEALIHSTNLNVPPQPTSCTIKTNRSPLETNFTLAPHVEFNQGRAVAATPNMDNTDGLHPLLARVLEDWVNNSDDIETAIVTGINDYIDNNLSE